LYRAYVDNPIHATDALGTQVKDDDFEKPIGVGEGISEKTLTPLEIKKKNLKIEGVCGVKGCDLNISIDKAYSGKYNYRAGGTAKPMPIRGIYYKISASLAGKGCPQCTNLLAVQIIRDFRRIDEKRIDLVDPEFELGKILAGWGDPKAKSPGWRVDVPPGGKSPYYGEGLDNHNWGGDLPGGGMKPIEIWDAPGYRVGDNDRGKDIYTVFLCHNADKPDQIVGVLHWGFYTNKDGTVGAFTPEASATVPDFFGHAIGRWNGIGGVQKIAIGGITQ
jgi:hypothetical protein